MVVRPSDWCQLWYLIIWAGWSISGRIEEPGRKLHWGLQGKWGKEGKLTVQEQVQEKCWPKK